MRRPGSRRRSACRAGAGQTRRSRTRQHRRRCEGGRRCGLHRSAGRIKGVNVVSEINSIGLIELSSVATGFLVEDAMLKAGSVQLLLARSICSGKFLIAVAGDVASVEAAVQAGAVAAGPSLIDRK